MNFFEIRGKIDDRYADYYHWPSSFHRGVHIINVPVFDVPLLGYRKHIIVTTLKLWYRVSRDNTRFLFGSHGLGFIGSSPLPGEFTFAIQGHDYPQARKAGYRPINKQVACT